MPNESRDMSKLKADALSEENKVYQSPILIFLDTVEPESERYNNLGFI